jgi:hypothetical protein
MILKKPIVASAVVFCAFLAACGSGPTPKPGQAEPQPPTPIVQPGNPAAFDPAKISGEEKAATFTDVRSLITTLNSLIQHKDYEAWITHLTQEYIAYYSNPEVLAQISEFPVLKRVGVKLKDLRDYFLYVVYPSRQNDRVDDVEFVGELRIKAITLTPTGDRQILYNLEKIGDTWKIGIGR